MTKKKKAPIIPISTQIEQFLGLTDNAPNKHKCNYDHAATCDKKTTDLSHTLELEKLNLRARAKLAAEWREVLRDRREAKDTAEVLAPLVKVLESQEGIAFLRNLRQCLGETRKVEERQRNRTYTKRISDSNPVIGRSNNT